MSYTFITPPDEETGLGAVVSFNGLELKEGDCIQVKSTREDGEPYIFTITDFKYPTLNFINGIRHSRSGQVNFLGRPATAVEIIKKTDYGRILGKVECPAQSGGSRRKVYNRSRRNRKNNRRYTRKYR